MYKLILAFIACLAFQFQAHSQITVSSANSQYDTIFGGTSIYYQYAWDDPLDEDYPETFKLSKPLKAFNILWDSARVSDGTLRLISSSSTSVYLMIDGTGWDIIDRGWHNDSLGLNNVSPIKISDSMDRVEWRSFGFFGELDSTWQLPSLGSVQIQVKAMNKVDIIFGDFAIVRPDLCFEGFGGLRPRITFSNGVDSAFTWVIFGDPNMPTLGSGKDTALNKLPDLGLKMSLDFNKTNSIKGLNQTYLKFHPNPVKDLLYLEGTQNFANSKYQIFNILGKEITAGELESNSINLENLIAGVYILSLNFHNHRFMVRFIKD